MITDADRQDWRNALAPPADIGMCEWCEGNIVIPESTGTPWPGAYRASETPWVRGWYEIIADPMTRLFAVMKGAQVACTQTFINAMLSWVVNDPGAALYVMDSMDNMRETSKLRLQPIIAASPSVRDEIRDDKDELENLLFQFQRAFMRCIGANSAGKAASFTHRYLLLEEPEKYKDMVGKEGNVIENLMKRVMRIWNHKILIGCTPSTKKGFIWKYVNMGDMCRYFVPCPHCGYRQVLRWDHVQFDITLSPVEAGRGAKYICPGCKKQITDTEKRLIVDDGIWRPTQKAKVTGYRSAMIGGLYPKDSSATVRNFVETFVRVRKNQSDLQVHINSDRGEIYEEPPKKTIGGSAIWKIMKENKYPRRCVPSDDDVLLLMFADVQAHHLVFSVWAMTLDDHWLVDHGFVGGLADLKAVYDEPAYRYVDGKIVEGDRKHIKIRGCFVDARHRTEEVYKFCAVNRGWSQPIMGQAANVKQQKLVAWRETDKLPNGKPILGSTMIKIAYLHPSHFKNQFAAAVEATSSDDEDVQSHSKVRIWFHEAIDSDYVKQLQGEVLRETPPDKYGDTTSFWTKVHTNDFFDLAQYSFAARYIGHNQLERMDRKKNDKPEETEKENTDDAKKTVKPETKPKPKPKRASYRDEDDEW